MTSFMMPFVYNGKPWISNDVIVCSSLLSLHAVYQFSVCHNLAGVFLIILIALNPGQGQ